MDTSHEERRHTPRSLRACANLYVENQATIQLVKRAVTTKKRKNLDLRIHFLFDHHKQLHATVHLVPSSENPADVLNKQLRPMKQRATIPLIGLHIHPSGSPVSVNIGQRGTARLHSDLTSPVLTDTNSPHKS